MADKSYGRTPSNVTSGRKNVTLGPWFENLCSFFSAISAFSMALGILNRFAKKNLQLKIFQS